MSGRFQNYKEVRPKEKVLFGEMSFGGVERQKIHKRMSKMRVGTEMTKRYIVTPGGKRRIFRRNKTSYKKDVECFYCGSSEDLTVDHDIPISIGGKNIKKNFLTACVSCNRLKGPLSKQEFIEQIKRLKLYSPETIKHWGLSKWAEKTKVIATHLCL